MKLIAFSLLLTAAVACTAASSTDETSTSNVTTTAATNDQRICTNECDWRDRCGTQTYAACMTSCTHRYVNHGVSLREEYVANAEKCFPTLTCSQTDDYCLERWCLDQPVPEVNACLVKKAHCGSGSFDSDLCVAIPALTDAARADAKTCFTADCANVRSCVKQAVGVN